MDLKNLYGRALDSANYPELTREYSLEVRHRSHLWDAAGYVLLSFGITWFCLCCLFPWVPWVLKSMGWALPTCSPWIWRTITYIGLLLNLRWSILFLKDQLYW